MSHPASSAASCLLYSRVEPDEHGNFEYAGDLQKPGLGLPALTAAIQRHLEGMVAGGHFSVRSETFAGGRKIIVEVLDAPADLANDEARHSFEIAIRDQVERFGFTRSNALQDYMACAFYAEVRIADAYWAARSDRRGVQNAIAKTMSLAAFKRAVRAGDRLKLVGAPEGHRSLGVTRPIVAVRSSDLILEGPSYLTLPKAAAFACDGKQIQIGIGTPREPDAHLLYEWMPAAA